jgi:thiol-disulfide isomerase/thioredoxin
MHYFIGQYQILNFTKTMKFYIPILLLVTVMFNAAGQEKAITADSLLVKFSKALQDLQHLQYTQTRELNYASENYTNTTDWSLYFDFLDPDTLTGFKYQIVDTVSMQLYNGTEKFELDKKNRSININASPTKQSFSSLSALYNSLLTLRNALPLIISDKSIEKKLTDTSINNKLYYSITLYPGKRRLQNLGSGFDQMKTPSNFVYKIIADKETHLPLIIYQGNDLNNDFIKTSFTKIQINPNPPSAFSWYYSTYLNEYKPLLNERLELLGTGSLAPDWKLQIFNSDKTLSLHELKGNIILVDFWIKNCGPCIQSVPHLNELQKKYKNQHLKIISINSYDSKNDIQWFTNKHKIEYPVLLNGKEIATAYGVSGFPSFFLINKRGTIIYSHAGYDLSAKAAIEKLLKDLQ